MYLCYYNCILTKAQGQLIITPSISNLHKPILFKASMFGVTGLPHRLWKYPHQTSLRPSKGIKGVVCCRLLSTPAQFSQGQARRENKREEMQWMCGSPQEEKTDRAQVTEVMGREGHLAKVRGKRTFESPLESYIHSFNRYIHKSSLLCHRSWRDNSEPLSMSSVKQVGR